MGITNRWYSLKEIRGYLGVSRDTIFKWIDKKICLHIKWADNGILNWMKLITGSNPGLLPTNIV